MEEIWTLGVNCVELEGLPQSVICLILRYFSSFVAHRLSLGSHVRQNLTCRNLYPSETVKVPFFEKIRNNKYLGEVVGEHVVGKAVTWNVRRMSRKRTKIQRSIFV